MTPRSHNFEILSGHYLSDELLQILLTQQIKPFCNNSFLHLQVNVVLDSYTDTIHVFIYRHHSCNVQTFLDIIESKHCVVNQQFRRFKLLPPPPPSLSLKNNSHITDISHNNINGNQSRPITFKHIYHKCSKNNSISSTNQHRSLFSFTLHNNSRTLN